MNNPYHKKKSIKLVETSEWESTKHVSPKISKIFLYQNVSVKLG